MLRLTRDPILIEVGAEGLAEGQARALVTGVGAETIFSGQEQQRRSQRIASAHGLSASQGSPGRGRGSIGGQRDISSWFNGGAQSQPPPQSSSAWGPPPQDSSSGNRPYDPAETISANDNVYSSDSDAEQDDEFELDNEGNLKTILLDIRRDVRKINTKFDKMKKSVKSLQKSNSELRKQNVELQQAVGELRVQVSNLQTMAVQNADKNEKLEAHSRRNNLLIYGIEEDRDETFNSTEEKFRDYVRDELGIDDRDISTERVHRLKSRSKPSPIIAKFSFYKDRDNVLKKYRDLRKERETAAASNGEGQNDNVSAEGDTTNVKRVGEDFPKRVRDVRRKLIPFMKAAHADNKDAYLKYDKLCVEGKFYIYSEDTEQPVLTDK